MLSHTSSATAAARIPKITELREQLNYGDAKQARFSAFSDDLRVFRRKYTTSTGLSGFDLWDWKSPQHQSALEEMTDAFLDREGYGRIYWPSNPNSGNFNAIHYAKDRPFIHRTMKQLIFRMNLQQYRNNKYKRKDDNHRNNSEKCPPDPKAHETIELDTDTSPSTEYFPIPKEPVASQHRISSDAPDAAAFRVQSTKQNQSKNVLKLPVDFSKINNEKETYEVPSSPEPVPTQISNLSKRKLPVAKSSQLPKRPRATDTSKPSRSLLYSPNQQRTSPRAKKTTKRPGYVHHDDSDRTFLSPTPTDSHADNQEHPKAIARRTPGEVIDYIRSNRPSVTSEHFRSVEADVPAGVQRASPDDANIDPNLERFVISSSTYPAAEPRQPAFTSSVTNAQLTNARQQQHPLPSPALTSTPQPVQDTTQSVHASVESSPHVARRAIARSKVANPQPKSLTTSSSTPPKPNIDFRYLAILSRSPVYQYKTWKPHGHFLDKSLSELILELPFGTDIKGLMIRLQGPGVAAEETLNCDEEIQFEATKLQFRKLVSMCHKTHMKTDPGKALLMQFEIEAVRDGEEDAGEEDGEEDYVF